jgi:hypothetical protein
MHYDVSIATQDTLRFAQCKAELPRMQVLDQVQQQYPVGASIS